VGWLRSSENLWSLGGVFQLNWFLILKLLLHWLSEESISIWHFSFSSESSLVNELISEFIFNSTVLDHELGLLEESLMLSLEKFELLQSIVTNFLELLFILSVDFSLNMLPVVL